jgi:hypothetical protein
MPTAKSKSNIKSMKLMGMQSMNLRHGRSVGKLRMEDTKSVVEKAKREARRRMSSNNREEEEEEDNSKTGVKTAKEIRGDGFQVWCMHWIHFGGHY